MAIGKRDRASAASARIAGAARERGTVILHDRPYYGQFTEWQGRLFPVKHDQSTMGRYSSTGYIDKVEFLDSVDSNTFRP